jgi:hypothetical protein
MRLLKLFNIYTEKQESTLPDYDKFLQLLSVNQLISTELLNYYKNRFFEIRFLNFARFYSFFYFSLKLMNPELVIGLCYYNPKVMALFAAAKKSGIPSIEIQHGPQSALHPAYGIWANYPDPGYEMLPDIFWTWDEKSKRELESGIARYNSHKIVNLGNPWQKFWEDESRQHLANYHFDNNIILVSLQPLGEIMDEFLIDAIKETHEIYDWWVRVHPRQLNKIKEIKDFFREKGILEYIIINSATNYPLPLILENTKLHLTKTSGTTLEAMAFGVKTIILYDLGKEYYYDLIEQGFVIAPETYTKKELLTLISKYLESRSERTKSYPENYYEELSKITGR